METFYQQTLENAKKRMAELTAQRDEIEREMRALFNIVGGAKIMAEPSEPVTLSDPPAAPGDESLGVTDAVRRVLRRAQVPLVPTEIRDALEGMGIEASSSRNLLVHVHNVIRRLVGTEIEECPRDGKMAYRMPTDIERFLRTQQPAFGSLTMALHNLGMEKESDTKPYRLSDLAGTNRSISPTPLVDAKTLKRIK
jgi:hypothetical protein